MHHPVQTIPEAPLVSIIVPVYNLETCVSSCLDSLLRQTWSPLEIILVNDGSTDRTAHVLNAYAALHRNITVITRDNAGVDAARYAGMGLREARVGNSGNGLCGSAWYQYATLDRSSVRLFAWPCSMVARSDLSK